MPLKERKVFRKNSATVLLGTPIIFPLKSSGFLIPRSLRATTFMAFEIRKSPHGPKVLSFEALEGQDELCGSCRVDLTCDQVVYGKDARLIIFKGDVEAVAFEKTLFLSNVNESADRVGKDSDVELFRF